MLSQARRFVIFAALASLLALTAAAPAPAQDPNSDQYQDSDGDGTPNGWDKCPYEASTWQGGGGCPQPDSDGDGVGDYDDQCVDKAADEYPRPEFPGCPGGGDQDGDGVIDAKDACPSEGVRGRVNEKGCALPPDGDGDGWADDEDGCPDKPANEQSPWPNGCPGHVKLAETPPASGPSCTSKMPCIVLERKGLSEKQSGNGYLDPDATVRLTIARDARGVPARVVGVQLRNVDTLCLKYGKDVYDVSFAPGPEVSADLDALALTKERVQYGNYSAYAFLFKAVRSIGGQQYRLGFHMSADDDRREAQFSISFSDEQNADHCSINIYGNNDPLTRTTTAAEKKAVKKAVAKCKKKPTETKKQRRKLKKCLKNARD